MKLNVSRQHRCKRWVRTGCQTSRPQFTPDEYAHFSELYRAKACLPYSRTTFDPGGVIYVSPVCLHAGIIVPKTYRDPGRGRISWEDACIRSQADMWSVGCRHPFIVTSELRKAGSGRADSNVIGWLNKENAASFYLSAITLMELEMGVQQIERKDAKQGALLRTWFDTHVIPEFSGRILPVDESVALCCAGLHIPNPRSERDALIAATALVHGMTVVTRNVADFLPTGVNLINP